MKKLIHCTYRAAKTVLNNTMFSKKGMPVCQSGGMDEVREEGTGGKSGILKRMESGEDCDWLNEVVVYVITDCIQ